MNWFKRKKKEPEIQLSLKPEIPHQCEHVWKDFSPYITYDFSPYYSNYKRTDHGKLVIKIIEPYVCCKCLKREDVELYILRFDSIKESEAKERFEILKKENKMLKPRSLIEDEIADMQHKIDRDLLRTIALYQPSLLGSNMPNNLPNLEKFLNGE